MEIITEVYARKRIWWRDTDDKAQRGWKIVNEFDDAKRERLLKVLDLVPPMRDVTTHMYRLWVITREEFDAIMGESDENGD